MLMFRLKTTPLSELFMSADLRAQWVDPFGRLVRCRLHFRLDKIPPTKNGGFDFPFG